MKPTDVTILFVPATDSGKDLRAILAAVAPWSHDWLWNLHGLDAVGAERLCQAVADAGEIGLWLDPTQLREATAELQQLIEGALLAVRPSEGGAVEAARCFRDTSLVVPPAVIGIIGVDGTGFDVLTPDAEVAAAIGQLAGVRPVDSAAYFGSLATQ
jgi:hypothetical protein